MVELTWGKMTGEGEDYGWFHSKKDFWQ